MAPQSLLLADFGHALLCNEEFLEANPRAKAVDLFTLRECGP
jgi:hypothetical protein